jgi:hypothetical protein
MFRNRLFPGYNFPARPDLCVIAMSRANVKNGTPIGSAHLCKSCTWGHVITGYRESDLLVMCARTDSNIVVPFAVYECTEFNDKHKPTIDQMRRLAIPIQQVRVSAKTAGFRPVETIRPLKKGTGESEAVVALDE